MTIDFEAEAHDLRCDTGGVSGSEKHIEVLLRSIAQRAVEEAARLCDGERCRCPTEMDCHEIDARAIRALKEQFEKKEHHDSRKNSRDHTIRRRNISWLE